jgi:hypothetical protein
MKNKTYISLTGIRYTFPVNIDGKTKWISISGEQLEYTTSNAKVQSAIENHSKFKDGSIGILSSGKEEKKENPEFESKEFPEVTILNEAVEILRNEPYKIAVSKLRNKKAIFDIAKDVGASFPNLSTD